MQSIYKKLAVIVFVSACISGLTAQNQPNQALPDTSEYPYYIQMMQDPEADFRATQSAFEKYWAGRTDYKGNGWKVFKRWEYINEPRVQPDGKLPAPDHVLKEYAEYQSTHLTESVAGDWTQIGPVNYPANYTIQPTGMGRINCIAFHPTVSSTFWAGAPSGGLWKTTNSGSTWTTLTSAMPTLGVSSILIHPTTPNTIWLGTGDRDAADAPGLGVYKSTDGGSTWNPSNTGMGNETVSMMIMHPSDPNTILAATSGGIFKTVNGGTNWTLKSSNTNYYKDIKFKPLDPSIVYAANYGNFYRSGNTGENWTQITSGVLSGTRLVIGVSPNQTSTVYLLQTWGPFVGLLKSTDSGLNFSTQSTNPNIMDYACNGSGGSSQASYDLCIAVDPTNANHIYAGGINTWKSTDGGVNWGIISHWVGSSWGTSCAPSVHADIHSLDWSPLLPGRLYSGGDGGVYYTINGGTTWTEISSTLAIAQVYKIGQSATVSNLVINGYQDNGTATNTGSSFTTVIGGDGMECIIDYSDNTYKYGALYYGDIRRSTGGWFYTIAKSGVNGITESGGWVTPYILHETVPSTMFVGYKNVWRSTNIKAVSTSSVTWTKISTGESSNCAVIEQSPANLDLLYVSRGTILKRSENANAVTPTWTTCTSPGFTVTDLEAHPTGPDTLYATGYGSVYKSTDKGVIWSDISGTLPNVGLNCIVADKNSNEGLYLGTQFGVFYRDATMSDWVQFDDQLPAVDVRELEIYYNAVTPSNNRLKAATYGRGLWESDLYAPAVPTNTALQNIDVTSGETRCDDATQTVTVAGGGTYFRVGSGGSSTIIAGLSINFLPGTTIYVGGYLNAYITTSSQYCSSIPNPLVENTVSSTGDSDDILFSGTQENRMFKVWPNPTTGTFILELKEAPETSSVEVEVYSMLGEKILSETLTREKRYEFSLSSWPAGLYFIRFVAEGKTETRKIIKQ